MPLTVADVAPLIGCELAIDAQDETAVGEFPCANSVDGLAIRSFAERRRGVIATRLDASVPAGTRWFVVSDVERLLVVSGRDAAEVTIARKALGIAMTQVHQTS